MITYQPIVQQLDSDLFTKQALSVNVLRLDLVHPETSGNKWFKLKRNLAETNKQDLKTIITFGGAFSNHIAATAAACKSQGLQSIGIIRGEELPELNATLLKAKENGMLLHFVSRSLYDQKESVGFKNYLNEKFGPHYLIPEGGNNSEGVLGCTEILNVALNHDYIFCAVGTGTTFAGLVLSAQPFQTVVGISVLKGENNLPEETEHLLNNLSPVRTFKISGNEELEKAWIQTNCITNDYAFRGYAKYDPELVKFKNEFESEFKIPLDHVYTNKLVYAVFDLVKNEKIKSGSKVLIIHSGGLQGNAGFEARYTI